MEKTQEWRIRRRGSLWRRLLLFLLVIAAMSIAVVGVVGWIASDRALGPDIRATAWSLDDYPDLQPETVTFESQTSIALEGRFFPGEHDAGVILLHGLSEGQDQVLPLADTLNRAGYNVLTYNGRHPERYGDGIYSTLGTLERLDLVSAVDYLAERPEVDPGRIGVYGASLGGATAILAGALDDRIGAVAAEGAFSDGDSVIASSFERYIGLPSFPFAPAARHIAEWRAGEQLNDARPVDAIAEIVDRPVLLIHGLEDESVPPDHSERNLEAGGENVEVWWVPDAGHFDAHVVASEEYAERMRAFFDDSLR